jgi:hypothetical protein
MATEQHKLGQDGTKRSGLSPVAQAMVVRPVHGQSTAAQAIMQTSARHFNSEDYGDHAVIVGFGGGDIRHPHAQEETDHGQ